MSKFTRTGKTKIRRLPKRGNYDRDTIYALIDEALICHVGFAVDGEPSVIPTAIARLDNDVYVHGNRVSRMLKHLAQGADACIVVTHLDGLVLARSGFHHSMNYRSVVIYGTGVPVTGQDKKRILDLFVERLIPGRTSDIRPINRKELNATTVVKFALDQVSAKIRTGPPVDDMEDYDLPIWAGELPLSLQAGKPLADPDMKKALPIPTYVKRYQRK